MRAIPHAAAFAPAPISGQARELQDKGYCILRGAASPSMLEALAADLAPVFARAPFCAGDFYGSRTKRFNSLLKRSPAAADFVMHPQVLELVHTMLDPWCDTLQLNLAQAIEIHPGAVRQPPHRDQDSWPFAQPEIEYCVNVMWALSDYCAANGATVLWPGSNRHQDAMLLPESEAICAEMEPGDCLIFTGSTLHHGGANVSHDIRQGVIIGYALGWLKPHENQWLAYPPAIARGFAPELAALVGYRQHYPNLGNWEGRCPSLLLGDDVADLPGPVDHIAPDKAALIKAWLSGKLDAA